MRGEAVLVNGAAGTSGRLALQVARHLGARRIVATARRATVEGELPALGAHAFISLTHSQPELTEAFRRELREHGANVLLDFLYGNSAEALLQACVGHARGDAEPPVRFVQIGTIAGPNVTLPATVLRSSGLELLGSGPGAVSHVELVKSIGEFLAAYRAGGFRVEAETAPLSDVTAVWGRQTRARVVLTP